MHEIGEGLFEEIDRLRSEREAAQDESAAWRLIAIFSLVALFVAGLANG